jgi:FkbM family methyltransferase
VILSYRLSLLRGALAGGDVQALAGVFRMPARFTAKPFIELAEPDGEYLVVRVRGIERPLLWPVTYPANDLYKVLTECFYPHDWHYYEIAETVVEPGMTVLDCGAAEGVFTLRVEPRAHKVYAFEPMAEYVRTLRATFDGSSKVEIVPKALSNKAGTGSIKGERYWSSVVTGDGDVEITTIDEWAGSRRVDYIKADVEGFEQNLLMGARETIRRCKPRIAITTYHPGNDAAEMIAFLRSIVPYYKARTKGTSYNSSVKRPVMLHAWV